MFTHDFTCSVAKQAVMTDNACKLLGFRMTARARLDVRTSAGITRHASGIYGAILC